MRLRLATTSAIAGCALVWLSGCAVDPAPKGSRLVVVAPNAEFYRNGPAQDVSFGVETLRGLPGTGKQLGPDFQLPRGSSVTMLKREFGFSQVVTDDGTVGYVANDQLQAAPAITRAAPMGLPQRERPSSPSRRSTPRVPAPEHLDLDDLPLPLPG